MQESCRNIIFFEKDLFLQLRLHGHPARIEAKNNYVDFFSELSAIISDNCYEKKEIKRVAVDLIMAK